MALSVSGFGGSNGFSRNRFTSILIFRGSQGFRKKYIGVLFLLQPSDNVSVLPSGETSDWKLLYQFMVGGGSQ